MKKTAAIILILINIPVVLFFHNCEKFEVAKDISVFTLSNASGNGGGYNGPNLFFELVPPIHESERLTRAELGQKLVQAQLRCQWGVPEQGLTGVVDKYFKIFISKTQSPCYLHFGQFSSITGNNYDYSKNLELGEYCIDYYSKVLPAKKAANPSSFVQPRVTAFSTFDPSMDPSQYQNDPSWKQMKFKVVLSDAQGRDIKHYSLSGNFPQALYTAQLPATDGRPSSNNKIQLLAANNINEEVPLMDSNLGVSTGGTFNSYEYMSCVQGEFYFSQDPQLQSKVMTSLITPAAIADSPLCPELSNWVTALNKRDSFDLSLEKVNGSFATTLQTWNEEYRIRKATAENLFQSYLKGQVDLNKIKGCLENSPHRKDFLYTLQSVFFFESLKFLKSQNSDSLNSLLNKIDANTPGRAWTMFYVAGLSGNTSAKAGVGREKLNTFMNLTEIPSKDWFLIFIHEMNHRVDDKMHLATKSFSDLEKYKKIQAEVKAGSNL
jgi:hypothetical protein